MMVASQDDILLYGGVESEVEAELGTANTTTLCACSTSTLHLAAAVEEPPRLLHLLRLALLCFNYDDIHHHADSPSASTSSTTAAMSDHEEPQDSKAQADEHINSELAA
jgi:hypothetical protein